jgi:hypothetical protein
MPIMEATTYHERARNLFSSSDTMKYLPPTQNRPIEAAYAFMFEADTLFYCSPGNSELITTSLALEIVYLLFQDHLISNNLLPDTETVAQELMESGMDDKTAVAMVSLALALHYEHDQEHDKRDICLSFAKFILSQSLESRVKQWLVIFIDDRFI